VQRSLRVITIRPYNSGDYEALLKILKSFNPSLPEQAWYNLLHYNWDEQVGIKGMVIADEKNIYGFLSFVNSTLCGVNFCNLSSWIVLPEHRSKSLKLLATSFQVKNSVIVNLSPHPDTRPLFTGLRFQPLSEYEYRINPFKANNFLRKQVDKKLLKIEELNLSLINSIPVNDSIKKIIRDHSPYSNICFYNVTAISHGNTETFILAFNKKAMSQPASLKESIKEIPYRLLGRTQQYELFYTSSPALVFRYFAGVIVAFSQKKDLRSINISDHFIDKQEAGLPYPVKTKKDCPMFYYSELNVKPSDISFLYTEKVLLNF
jgi:hypothetical protein